MFSYKLLICKKQPSLCKEQLHTFAIKHLVFSSLKQKI